MLCNNKFVFKKHNNIFKEIKIFIYKDDTVFCVKIFSYLVFSEKNLYAVVRLIQVVCCLSSHVLRHLH